MRREVEETIRKFYDDNVYINPLLGHDKYQYKQSLMEKTKAYIPPLIKEIQKRISDNIDLASPGCYYYETEVVIDDAVVLWLSWLGPFATFTFRPPADEGSVKEIIYKLQKVLEDKGVILLSDEEINEPVDWLESGSPFISNHPTVWNCLFAEV
jgi:hypothetical protein